MRAELARTSDIPSWLEIVSEVQPLFGSMVNFEETLVRKINERGALCVRSHKQCGSACVWVAYCLAAARHRGGSDGLLSDPPREAWALGSA
jgi:hypothetical protein